MTKFKRNNLRITFKHITHILILIKTPAKFSKVPGSNIVGGAAFTRYPVSMCFGRRQA